MNRLTRYSIGLLSLCLLAACSDDDDSPSNASSPNMSSSSMAASSEASSTPAAMMMYQITVLNATAGQPLGPVAAVISDEGLSIWSIGEPASEALEMLAEAGMPDEFLANHEGIGNGTNGAVTMPGMSAMVELTVPAADSLYLSLAAMPVNTNDAFIGLQNIDLGGLEVGMYSKHYAPVYDAGTEANTEGMNTIPGPAAGGMGFDALRDDIANQVTRHPGVTGKPEAGDSALTEMHRFDSNSFIVTILRTQ